MTSLSNKNNSTTHKPDKEEYILESQISYHVLDAIMIFIAIIDTAGNTAFLNKRARNILNSHDGKLIGKNFVNTLISKNERSKIRSIINRMLQKGVRKGALHRYSILDSGNQNRVIDAGNIPIIDAHNNIKGIFISGKDLTDQISEQESLEKDIHLNRALLNNIPEINIFVFDVEMRFLLAEGIEMKNLGMSGKAFEGKLLNEVENEEIQKLWAPLFRKALKGQKVRKEYRLNNFNYLIRITPLSDISGGISRCVAVTRNITGEKLSKKILNKAREEAVKSEKAKSRFLANVSHEIRTPLNAILGFTEQLLQSDLSENQKKYLEIIDRSSGHLLALINDILVLSKIETNQISFENSPFKLKSVLEYIYKAILVKAEDKGLLFTYELNEGVDIVLLGDAYRLQQILMNLLNNAVKFTEKGSIKLICFLEKDDNDEIIAGFEITDTGIGISSSHLKKIFREYTRLGKIADVKNEGAGLGLAICKNLINLQNGSLSVSSQKGFGTTFRFTIPYSKGKEADLPSMETDEMDTENLKDKRILLVDDDTVNLLLASAILEKFQCNFDTATNGNQAIEMLEKKSYDLILLDIHMPDISGVEVAKFIRNVKKDKKCRILAITAAALKDDLIKYKEAGINDFLIKPFREINLFNKICEVLKIKGKVTSKTKTEIILKSEITPKPFDLSELQRMAENDEDFIIHALKVFIENAEETVINFKKAHNKGNWTEIGEIVHKILPSFKHLDMEKIVPLLVKLKTRIMVEKEITGLDHLLSETIEEINTVIKDIQNEIINHEG